MRLLSFFFPLAIFLASCQTEIVPFKPFIPPPEEIPESLEIVNQSLLKALPRYHERGQIVSRLNGVPTLVGDSLFFTGMAIAVVPCNSADVYYSALEKMIRLKSTLYRFDPLPPEYIPYPVSYDGIAAVFYGFSKKFAECPNDHDRIRGIVEPFRLYLKENGIFYSPAAITAKYEFGLDYAPELLAFRLGLRDTEPHPDFKSKMEMAVNTWAFATVAKKKGCFRIHLSTLNLLSVHYLGVEPSRSAKDSYCEITKGIGFPLGDYLCQRMTAVDYLSTWIKDEWNYRLQRCKWERVDGFGQEHAGLDFLMIRDLAR